MENLRNLAKLIDARNQNEREITALIGRPAAIGHIGEYIASKVFNIILEESATHKASDGYFIDELFNRKTVNIKWYSFQEGVLDITPLSLPDYYLVLTGLKPGVMSSRGSTRPWTIEKVFLFAAHSLVNDLKLAGVKIGIATSIRKKQWEKAEIYPEERSELYRLSSFQREALSLFRSKKDA